MIHISNNNLNTDYLDNSQHNDQSLSKPRTASIAADVNSNYTRKCFAFRYVSQKDLPNEMKKESVQTRYGCDLDSYCEGLSVNEIVSNVSIKGHTGQIFCCEGNNCNSLESIPHLAVENSLCYEGVHNKSGTFGVSVKSCGHLDAKCVKKTRYSGGEVLEEEYHCDHDRSCERSLLSSGAIKSCNLSLPLLDEHAVEELGCCEGDLCLKPENFNPTLLANLSSPYRSLYPYHSDPIIKPFGIKSPNRMVLSGVVAALVMLVAFGIGIGVVMLMKRSQNRGLGSDGDVVMQYERLTNNEADATIVL